jgi:pimeloyl-[acyl-carrier protein] methyl ester esterase
MPNDLDCLLLHGWGVSNSILKEFAGSLKGFKNVSIPCLYEIASETKNYKFKSMSEALSDHVETDTVIVAWSIGGLLATPLAKLTNNIKAIIFVASSPCFVNKKEWLNVIDQKNINSLQNKLSSNTNNALNYFAGLVAHGETSMKDTNKIVRNNIADEKYQAILLSWLKQMQETDQRKLFSELRLPIQIILGKNDSLINSNIEKQLKLLNPGIESQIINDCGHVPFLGKQQQTTNIINEFIYAKLI